MDYKKHVEFFFLSLICGIGSFALHFISQVNDNTIKMIVAIHEINVKMETITTDIRKQNERFDSLDARVRMIEKQFN